MEGTPPMSSSEDETGVKLIIIIIIIIIMSRNNSHIILHAGESFSKIHKGNFLYLWWFKSYSTKIRSSFSFIPGSMKVNN